MSQFIVMIFSYTNVILGEMLLKETWFFLNSGLHDAATNMAIDEALLEWHSKGEIPPVIRFYGWKNPSLTVGHFQNVHKTIDFSGVKKHGCDFVRRLTGGSAVLHDDELTYSVIVQESHAKIPHTVNDAYYVLSQGLLEGYRRLGIMAEFAQPQRSKGNRSAVCFETPAMYEMLANGKKLSGNAQTRRKGVLLQHGSLPMSFDADMLFDLFTFSSEERRQRQRSKFVDKATSIHELIDETYTYDLLVPIFLCGFEKSLQIELKEMELSLEQWEFIEYLRSSKYANDAWNKREKQIDRSVSLG